MKKENIILIGIIMIIIIPIIINEIKMRPRLALVNDVKEILKNIDNYESKESIEEIIIDNGYKLHNKRYDVKGKGVIFIEEKPSIMLNRNGMCAIKMPYSDDIMFQKEECPEYRLINGKKERVTK